MSTLMQCPACGKLTFFSYCPLCETAAALYANPGGAHAPDASARKPPLSVTLTLEDIDVIAKTRACLSAIRPSGSEQTNESTEDTVAALLTENESLLMKVQEARRQMLRSAMAIRELQASHTRVRENDRQRIDQLRQDNTRLTEQLAKAETAARAAAAAAAAPSSSHHVPDAPEALDTSPPPLPIPPTPAASAGATKEHSTAPVTSLLDSAEHALSSSSTPSEVLALQAEVERLQAALKSKTQQLDDLWERAERAERHVQNLLGKLGFVQDITQEETRNTERLSQHLQRIGEPPEDLASFMAIKDRPSESRETPTNSTSSKTFAVPERKSFLTRTAEVGNS